MDVGTKRAELKAFLRARREALAPESIGMQRGKRRITPGLRREEIAALAEVGVTWYTWLEQGRPINISASAMKRISRALRLSPTDEIYLFSLAGLDLPEQKAVNVSIPESLQNLLNSYQAPAFILDPLTEVLAFNPLAHCLYDFDKAQGRLTCNHLWSMFMNPERRRLYVNFEACVPGMLGLVRMNYATRIGDPNFDSLLTELSDASPEFARLWNKRWTSPLAPPVATRMTHPSLGILSVHSTRFPIDAASGTTIVFLAPADDATRESFKHTIQSISGLERALVDTFAQNADVSE